MPGHAFNLKLAETQTKLNKAERVTTSSVLPTTAMRHQTAHASMGRPSSRQVPRNKAQSCIAGTLH